MQFSAQSSTLVTLQNTAALAIGSIILKYEHGQDVKLRSISWLVDNA